MWVGSLYLSSSKAIECQVPEFAETERLRPVQLTKANKIVGSFLLLGTLATEVGSFFTSVPF